MKNKDKHLEVKLENDVITISIGIDTLAFAAKHAPDGLFYDKLFNPEGPIKKIIDKKEFAKDVVYELQREEEDGTTMVHLLFDKAINDAVDNGTCSCEYKGDK